MKEENPANELLLLPETREWRKAWLLELAGRYAELAVWQPLAVNAVVMLEIDAHLARGVVKRCTPQRSGFAAEVELDQRAEMEVRVIEGNLLAGKI